MSSPANIIEPIVTGTVGFERKVNIPVDGYGTESATVSIYLPFEVDLTDPAATEASMVKALATVKEQVLIESGLGYEFTAEARVVEQVRETFQAPTLTAAPATEAPASRPPAASGGGDVAVGNYKIMRVLNTDLPDWLPKQLEASGLPAGTEFWDNRRYLPEFGGTGSPKAPWFKQKGGDKAIWPPR